MNGNNFNYVLFIQTLFTLEKKKKKVKVLLLEASPMDHRSDGCSLD